MDLYLPIAVYFSLNCKTCYFGATGQITHTEMIWEDKQTLVVGLQGLNTG